MQTLAELNRIEEATERLWEKEYEEFLASQEDEDEDYEEEDEDEEEEE